MAAVSRARRRAIAFEMCLSRSGESSNTSSHLSGLLAQIHATKSQTTCQSDFPPLPPREDSPQESGLEAWLPPPSAATEPQWDCIYLAQDFLLDNGLCAWNKATAKTAIDLGLRNRYIWNIENAGYDIPDIAFYGAPEEYIAAVAADKFGVRNWRALDLDKLRMLLITIKNRVRKAAKKGRNLHTPNPAAEPADDNCPF